MIGSLQPRIRPRVSEGNQTKEVFVPSLRDGQGGHRPGHLEIQHRARHQRQQYSQEVFRIEHPLNHASLGMGLELVVAFARTEFVASVFAGEPASFLSSHWLNSLSRRNRRFKDS